MVKKNNIKNNSLITKYLSKSQYYAGYLLITIALLLIHRSSEAGYLTVFSHHGNDCRAININSSNARKEWLKRLPFDGVTINTSASYWFMSKTDYLNFPNTSYDDFTYESAASDLRTINLGNLTENYLLLKIRNPGDFFNDSYWNRVAQNFGTFAKVAKDLGYKGLLFDNEEDAASDGIWLYPTAANIEFENTYTLSQYQQKAQTRGYWCMDEISKNFPDCKVIVLHGPYRSVSNRPFYVAKNQIGSLNLDGPFFTGMFESSMDRRTANPNSYPRIWDGGEVYQFRDSSEYNDSAYWRINEFPKPEFSPWLWNTSKTNWVNQINITFGLMDEKFPSNATDMTPTTMENCIRRSLPYSDDLVWMFSEQGASLNTPNLQWMNPDNISQSWVAAVSEGRLRGGGSLINNGSFERETFESWYNWGGLSTTENDTYRGKKCALVAAGNVGGGRTAENPATSGRTYRLDGWAKKDSGNTVGEMGLIFYDINYVPIGSARKIFGIDQPYWKYYRGSFTAPPNSAYFSAYLYKSTSSGTLCIDNIAVY
jgi:hypothetical protein